MNYSLTQLESDREIFLPYEVAKLEGTEIITTNKDNRYTEFDDIPFDSLYSFLYHGIRFQTYLEKLENIFREKKILAGKYIKGYINYDENANKGEYVSLLNRFKTGRLYFETFIEENISLLITPFCNAIETKYIDDSLTWRKIKDLNLKHIYSYIPGEYMCKDFIPLEYVKVIGVPYKRLVRKRGIEYANKILEDVVLLMKKYNIFLSIVDTSRFNELLVSSSLKIDDNFTQEQKREFVLTKKLTPFKNTGNE